MVFKIPDQNESNLFIEKSGMLHPQQDSIFTFSFLPSKELIKKNIFTVNVTGFKDPDKEIFGNTRISVQSISNVQNFQDELKNGFESTSKNTITASYRRIGNDLDMYQILGKWRFQRFFRIYFHQRKYPFIKFSDRSYHQQYIHFLPSREK